MNYNDGILENKAFNFFKQLMYNLALAICILMVGVLIMVYGFGFKLYEVVSYSQEPYFTKGDMVIVKAQDEYKIGDIIQFVDGGENVCHRLIAIYHEDGKMWYLCHGDNVQSANPNNETHLAPWKKDAEYIQQLLDQNNGSLKNLPEQYKPINCQKIERKQIVGTVVNHIDNIGSIIAYIKSHYLLVISLVAGIWCVTNVVQNETEIKKSRRLT